jgi:deoxyribodipyrimidine photo-lyase
MERRTPNQVVWFKRDLRVKDHAPLMMAAERGAVLPLYIIEPSLIHAPDFAPAHWTFIRESLLELRESLAALGQPLIVRVGEAVEVFEALRHMLPIAAVYAHEETGNGLSYARDRAVRRYFRAQGIPFTEIPQTGAVRGLRNRDEWQALRDARMAQPIIPIPARLTPLPDPIDIGAIPTHADLGLPPDTRTETQRGGESQARRVLLDFLMRRGAGYVYGLSSPSAAVEACSRISPYLTWGNLSIRQATQATAHRLAQLGDSPRDARWRRSLEAFQSRLAWRCHFIQKLETEPELEFRNLARAYDGMREDSFNPDFFDAWREGRTGYPLVDAAMRAVAATGWLNFRMRAMVVSFAAYDLWLHWREPALHLARMFLDYEPGIHYSQMQMQSGTTGMNTIRVYNPTKQALDHDPEGVFIRRWLPELAPVPNAYIHMPAAMPTELQRQIGVIIGRDYPAPIVDHEAATAAAKAAIYAIRKSDAARAEHALLVQKHGSRRRPPDWRRARSRRRHNPDQPRLF